MKSLTFALAAALAAATFASDGVAETKPDAKPEKKSSLTAKEKALRCRELYERYAGSFATVNYYLKKDLRGVEPNLSVAYRCPNCGGSHNRRGAESAEKGIPAEFIGFVVAPDRILMRNVMIDPAFVDRIEVECAGEKVAASEVEVAPSRHALFLKTERPLASAKPLEFAVAPEPPSDPDYFYIARENGDTVAGFTSPSASSSRHLAGIGHTIYRGVQNAIVLGEGDAPLTVALDDMVEAGTETYDPPSAWATEPASVRFERLDAAEARVRRGLFPVYLQFEAKAKESGRLSFFSSRSSSEIESEKDSVGILLAGGRVLIPLNISPADTARMSKIEAKLPGGEKVELEFEGTLAEQGGLCAKFKGGLPAGLEPFDVETRGPLELWGERFFMVSASGIGGKLDLRRAVGRVSGFSRERGNVTVAEFDAQAGCEEDDDGWCQFVASKDGRLVCLGLKGRFSSRWSDPKSVQGAALAKLASDPQFDAENVPRETADRRRTPWLGVDVQAAGADVVREKGAGAYLKCDADEAALVLDVASGSPAERLGVKKGDVLVSVRHISSTDETALEVDRDHSFGIDWEKAFADSRFSEFASSGEVTPWPDAEGGINGILAKFGVGAEVVVVWVSEGERKEGRTKLDLAPVHFRNAPRARSKDLGITVCDMTYEVRKFLKLDEGAPGVVVVKVKGGGVADVAGIRPLEIVVDVNGEGVTSAKDFVAKTKDKTDLTLKVLRLNATRVVPIRR